MRIENNIVYGDELQRFLNVSLGEIASALLRSFEDKPLLVSENY